jgi:iron complex transport system substrate-binding protein
MFINMKIEISRYGVVYCCMGMFFCQKTYKRIVSLAPSLTQSLYYLEAQSNLVGCTSYCEAAKKTVSPLLLLPLSPTSKK